MLCDHGADVNAQCMDGATALYSAARNGRLECVQMLLEHGADPNLATNREVTPLLTVVINAKPQSAAIVEALLQAGAVASARNDRGKTALHLAAKNDLTHAATMLLKAGATPDDERKCKVDHVHKTTVHGGHAIIPSQTVKCTLFSRPGMRSTTRSWRPDGRLRSTWRR